METHAKILVLGLGNILLTDDGVGVHVINALEAAGARDRGIRCLDGGTMGLSLLPDIEAAEALILVDASEIQAAPGAIAVFEGIQMDLQLGGKKRTAHEVAAFDLLATAAMLGRRPEKRALIAVQPDCLTWGLEPTAPVGAAIPQACAIIEELIRRWGAAAGPNTPSRTNASAVEPAPSPVQGAVHAEDCA